MMSLKALLLGFTLLLTPSAAMAANTSDNGDYVYILIARGNSYWTTMANGIQDAAQSKGVKAVVYNTDSATDAEQQLNICQTAIQRKPKAIVMSAINASIATQCFKMAAENGIVFADIDGSFSVADGEKAGLKLAFSVGSDNYVIGQEAAQYTTQIAGKPNPKVFILEGTVGSLQARKRADGFRDKLKELLPQADVVASIAVNFDRIKAMNATLDILQRQPDLDMIYAANDDMALGAAEAVRNLHKEKQIKIIGVDGTADARKAVTEGRLTATVAQLPYLMGMRSVEMAMDAVATHKTGLSETTATPVLTKELIDANKDPVLTYVR
jgi:D-allose transport system substrate-binding protein